MTNETQTLDTLLGEIDALAGYSNWMDADPSEAWSDPDSWHGKIAEILGRAGWESCYHGDARFHYNAKVRGMGAWRGFQDGIDSLGNDARSRVEEISTEESDSDLEIWWRFDLPERLREIREEESPMRADLPRVYSCGRSGGYVNCSDLESRPREMILLGEFVRESREYFDSEEYGRYLAERSIELDLDTQLAKLASPRPDRIEA